MAITISPLATCVVSILRERQVINSARHILKRNPVITQIDIPTLVAAYNYNSCFSSKPNLFVNLLSYKWSLTRAQLLKILKCFTTPFTVSILPYSAKRLYENTNKNTCI